MANVMQIWKSWNEADQQALKALQAEEEMRTGKKPALSEMINALATDAEKSA